MEVPSERLHRLVMEVKPSVGILTECFRNLRNSCVGNTETQAQLGQSDSVLSDVSTAISTGLGLPVSEEWTLCLRISAQFLGNLVVTNTKNQEKVWSRFRSMLTRMARHGDTKLTNTSLMIIYNVLLGCPELTKDLVSDQELLIIVCESGAEGLEFGQYIVEHMLTQDLDWAQIYNSELPVTGRLFVLDVVESRLLESPSSVPTSLVSQLSKQFCKHSECILRTVADRVDGLEPVEVATLLRLLASCSPHPPHQHLLQNNNNFLINCAFLLKSIHMAGKEQNNCFSAVSKLSEADDQMQSHPGFGFKAGLVQVLGNLSWKHKHNQDLMRELEVIPVLLDCCNIDSRNPFIIQWVILAVRNLCEGNPENQSVIASMNRQGVVESAVLKEFGLTLHADGSDQIRIAPLDTTPR